MKGLMKLVAAGSMLALLAGCGAITGQMSKPRGGLAGMGEFPATGFSKTYEANTPQIFGGEDRYRAYLAAKDKLARLQSNGGGPLDLFGDNGGEAFMQSANGGGRPSFTPPPYTGSNVIKVNHEADGTIVAQVTESGSDCSVDRLSTDWSQSRKLGRQRSALTSPDSYFRQHQIFVSYFTLTSNGVLAGETFSPEFLGGSRPVWIYLGKLDPKTGDAELADYVNTLVLNQPKPALVAAAINNQGFCSLGTGGYFCKLTGDDKDVLGKAITGDYATAKATLSKLDTSIFAELATGAKQDAAGKPAKKELSW
jgi:hypothetical protein